jgi:hypothetical protein
VPAVNRDNFEWINSGFNTENWETIKSKRKNMNDLVKCTQGSGLNEEVDTGVDLNRNYESKSWGKDDYLSKDPCDQTYRGR